MMCVFVVDYISSVIVYSGIFLFLIVVNVIVCIFLYFFIIWVIYCLFFIYKMCLIIVFFCGVFEDLGFENENSVSLIYCGK